MASDSAVTVVTELLFAKDRILGPMAEIAAMHGNGTLLYGLAPLGKLDSISFGAREYEESACSTERVSGAQRVSAGRILEIREMYAKRHNSSPPELGRLKHGEHSKMRFGFGMYSLTDYTKADSGDPFYSVTKTLPSPTDYANLYVDWCVSRFTRTQVRPIFFALTRAGLVSVQLSAEVKRVVDASITGTMISTISNLDEDYLLAARNAASFLIYSAIFIEMGTSQEVEQFKKVLVDEASGKELKNAMALYAKRIASFNVGNVDERSKDWIDRYTFDETDSDLDKSSERGREMLRNVVRVWENMDPRNSDRNTLAHTENRIVGRMSSVKNYGFNLTSYLQDNTMIGTTNVQTAESIFRDTNKFRDVVGMLMSPWTTLESPHAKMFITNVIPRKSLSGDVSVVQV